MNASRYCIATAMALAAADCALATSVEVVGLFPGKAVLMIDGSRPRTLAVGERSAEGVRLLAVDAAGAVLEIDGKRRNIALGGQGYSGAGDAPSLTHLTADGRGHFFTLGSVNGVNTRFLVDTGASLVSLGAGDATRAGLDYRQGQAATVMTANGAVKVWTIKLRSVRIGDLTLNEVDAAVHEQDLPIALLGMSFLNRTEMQRNGDTLILKKRF